MITPKMILVFRIKSELKLARIKKERMLAANKEKEPKGNGLLHSTSG
jgi:hypothetical protein